MFNVVGDDDLHGRRLGRTRRRHQHQLTNGLILPVVEYLFAPRGSGEVPLLAGLARPVHTVVTIGNLPNGTGIAPEPAAANLWNGWHG